MKPCSLCKPLFLLIAVIALAFFLGHEFYQRQRDHMQKNAEFMKTLCVGRFLLEVPQKAIVSYRGARISGWEISSWVETDEEFLIRISNEEIKLRSQKNEKNAASLEQVVNVKNDTVLGRIFVFNRMWLEFFNFGIKERTQAISVLALLRIRDVTYSFHSESTSDEDVPQLEKLILQLAWRRAEDLPRRPGFCFDRGFLAEPLSANQSEFTAVFVGLPEHPDLAIALSTSAGINQDKSLLQREADNQIKQQYSSRFHVLRLGARAINGIPGEEVLDRVDEPNGSVLHGFMWESITTKDDVYRPVLALELHTGRGKPGQPVNSSLSDPEVLALWEGISGSLRVRPISE